MADEADVASDYEARMVADGLAKVPKAAMGEWVAGECDWCGLHFPRIVGGACGRCRDEFKLP